MSVTGQDPADALTDAENSMVNAVAAGRVADLGGETVRAAVVRSFAFDAAYRAIVTSAGVRLRNGTIEGRLDLEGADFDAPMVLTRIFMSAEGQNGSLLLRDGRFRRLVANDCAFAAGIVADRARFDNGIMIGGGRIAGAILVRGSQIGSAMSIEGTLLGDGQTALLTAGAEIDGPLILRRARCFGEVRLQRARLRSGLRADDLTVSGDGALLHCDSARMDGDVQLTGARIEGPVRFENVHIGGGLDACRMTVVAASEGIQANGLVIAQSLDLSGAKITGLLALEGAEIGKGLRAEATEIDGGETAIAADVIRIGGNWEMPQARLVGQIRCPGARVHGQFRCTGIKLYGSDLAIRADGARIDGGCYFSRSLIVGTVRFPAAEIGNQFRFRGATLKSETGPALLANGATLKRDAELNDGFETIGGVWFDQTRIHGTLDLRASKIKSVFAAIPPAVPQISDVAASASPYTTAVSLIDTEIDRIEMPSHRAERPRGIVDLSRAKVGAYVDWAEAWPPASRGERNDVPDHLILDGFTYEHLENPAGRAPGSSHRRHDRAGDSRLQWLLAQRRDDVGERFKPQAWVYLSRQLAAQGLDRDARQIIIERRRRERRSRWSTRIGRAESLFLDWFALYGFNPWRSVMWMAAVIGLFAGVWAWAATECRTTGCFDERVFVTSKRDAFSAEKFTDRYPPFHALAYSFDVFVPFVSFGYEDHWRPNMRYGPIATMTLPNVPAFVGGETNREKIFADVTLTTGSILYVLVILQKLLGLVLTSVAVTGFTGLLRQD